MRLQQFALRLAVVITLIVLLLQGTIIQPIVYGQSISSSSPQPQPQLILKVIAAAKLAIVIYFKIKETLELVQFAKEAWEAYQTQGCDGLTSKLVEKAPEWLIGKVMNLNRNQDWLEGIIGEFGAPTASEALGNILKEKGVSEKICEKIQKLKSKGLEGVEAVKKAIEKNKSKITSALKSTLKAIEKKFKSSDKKRKEPGPINPPIPPQIISVDIPRTIVIGTPTIWTLEFYDPDKDITFIAWDNGDGFDPGVRGQSQGKIAIQTTCNEPGMITSRVFLRDAAGNTSTPYQYSYQCVSSGTPPPPPTQPPPPPPPIDSDNDGIPDNQDQCPYQWGPAPTGCPVAPQPPPPSNNDQPKIEYFYYDDSAEQLKFEVSLLNSSCAPPYVYDKNITVNIDFGDGSPSLSYNLEICSALITEKSKKYYGLGPYTATLKVCNSSGVCDTATTNIFTTHPTPLPPPPPGPPPPPPTRQPPVAQFTMSADGEIAFENEVLQLVVPVGETVTVRFSASRSFDPDGTIVSYQWFINGTPVSQSRDFSFDLGANAPQHLIHLIITDNDGYQAEVGATVIIEEDFGVDDAPWLLSLENTAGFTSVQVYSVQGKLIYQLEEIPPYRRWQWDMRDQYGTRVPNGVYLAVITVRDLSGYPIRREVRRVVVLR